MRDVTPEELAASDGSDPSRPMLISIRGVVYDVTKGKDFYGPGGEWGGAQRGRGGRERDKQEGGRERAGGERG